MGHFKILGARSVIRNKFHTENPLILGASLQTLVPKMTRRPDFYTPGLCNDRPFYSTQSQILKTSLNKAQNTKQNVRNATVSNCNACRMTRISNWFGIR
jgi:hypothetical protein